MGKDSWIFVFVVLNNYYEIEKLIIEMGYLNVMIICNGLMDISNYSFN